MWVYCDCEGLGGSGDSPEFVSLSLSEESTAVSVPNKIFSSLGVANDSLGEPKLLVEEGEVDLGEVDLGGDDRST